jgi:hypothetical protein
MSGDHAKKMVIGREKSTTSHGKAPSRESTNKKKDGSPHTFDRTRVARRRRK